MANRRARSAHILWVHHSKSSYRVPETRRKGHTKVRTRDHRGPKVRSHKDRTQSRRT